MSNLREQVSKCLDDTHDLATLLYGAKNELLNGRDCRYELRNAESKLNKVIEEFNLIIKEIDNHAKENT